MENEEMNQNMPEETPAEVDQTVDPVDAETPAEDVAAFPEESSETESGDVLQDSRLLALKNHRESTSSEE